MGGESIVNNNGSVDGDEEDLKIAAKKLAKRFVIDILISLEETYKRAWDIFEHHAVFLVGFVGFSILIIYIVGQLVKGLVGLISIKNIKDRRVTKSTSLKKLGNDLEEKYDVNNDDDDVDDDNDDNDDDIDDDYGITSKKNHAPHTNHNHNHNTNACMTCMTTQRQRQPTPPPPVVASPPTPRRHLHYKRHRQSSTLAYVKKITNEMSEFYNNKLKLHDNDYSDDDDDSFSENSLLTIEELEEDYHPKEKNIIQPPPTIPAPAAAAAAAPPPSSSSSSPPSPYTTSISGLNHLQKTLPSTPEILSSGASRTTPFVAKQPSENIIVHP